VSQPLPWNATKLLKRDPIVVAKTPAVQHHWRLIESRQLQQTKTAELRLKPSGLNVKRNKRSVVERVKVLDPLKDFHAW